MSPFATPWSMMSAFRVGRYRDAMDCASWKTTTASSSSRCGLRYSTSNFQSMQGPNSREEIRSSVYDRIPEGELGFRGEQRCGVEVARGEATGVQRGGRPRAAQFEAASHTNPSGSVNGPA